MKCHILLVLRSDLSYIIYVTLHMIPKFHLISWFGDCAFPQNFNTRKLGEISLFYAVLVRKLKKVFMFFIKGTGKRCHLKTVDMFRPETYLGRCQTFMMEQLKLVNYFN